MTARTAYHVTAERIERVIITSEGKIWIKGEGWVYPQGQVVKVGRVYERWTEVNAAWTGIQPWFP